MTTQKSEADNKVKPEYAPSKKEVPLDKLNAKASEIAMRKAIKYKNK